MTFAEVEAMRPSPPETVLEWTDESAKMLFGSALSKFVPVDNHRLDLPDECIDEIVLTKNGAFESRPDLILLEAKRVLKKNGRIIISFYNDETHGFFAKWLNRIKPQKIETLNHMKASLDDLSQMISTFDLLIDKNFVVENDIVFFEVIKLENDKLGRLIWT